jgi:hypothetical protein
MAGVSEDEGHLVEYCGRTAVLGSIFTIALLALAMPLAAGCASDEREFGAEEFIEEANSHGAGLELGPPLDTTEGDAELYEVTVETAEGEEAAEGEEEHPESELGHSHGGGSLKVLEDAGAAETEYARCEETASLFCYRAANIALVFDAEASPDDLGRVAVALEAMQRE